MQTTTQPPTLALADMGPLTDILLRLGKVRLRVASDSMAPTLSLDDEILVEPVAADAILPGEVILFRSHRQLLCHRVVDIERGGRWGQGIRLLTRGDAHLDGGEEVRSEDVVGRVVHVRPAPLWRRRATRIRVAGRAMVHRLVSHPLAGWLSGPTTMALAPLFSVWGRLVCAVRKPELSFHLGVSHQGRWRDWHHLPSDRGGPDRGHRWRLPQLPDTTRPHALVARWGRTEVGSSLFARVGPAWRCSRPAVRLRFRGLGVEEQLQWMCGRLLADLAHQPQARALNGATDSRPASRA